MLIHNPTLIRRCECAEVRACGAANRFSFNLPFYARIQRLGAEGELGVGSLLLTAVWRGGGVLWAPEVLDKVQGLVCTKPANKRQRQRTQRTSAHVRLIQDYNSTSNLNGFLLLQQSLKTHI